MKPEEMTPEEAYQEALRRIAITRTLQLTNLDLRGLSLNRIPSEIFDLKWLTVLLMGREKQLQRGQIEHLPSELALLTSLQILDISWQRITDLSPLAELRHLKHLNFRANQISDLEPLQELHRLEFLVCGDNRISDLKPIRKLYYLQCLFCWDNRISDLGPLTGFHQLRQLEAAHNQISDLGPLAQLFKLRYLNCGNNRINVLEPLKGLSNLQYLACWENQISDLRPLVQLHQLQQLHCSHNQISDLASLAELHHLHYLDCKLNRVSDLRPLAKLHQLQHLDCRDNQISDLAPLVGLTQLQQLHCGTNQISDLAPLAGLTRLLELDCAGNRISDLSPIKPAVLSGQMTKLWPVVNPLRSLPAELLKSGYPNEVAKKLRNYWQELEQGAEPNRDVKVILIGNGCVGKTTLTYALRHRCRPPEQIIERTHGIVIDTLEWQIPEDEQPVKVQLWDFGGQEIYHATHRLFLHRNALYLLLWAEETDEAPSETRHPVGYWSNLIHHLAADSPMILVKNQIDRSDRLPRPVDLQDESATFVQELKISALQYRGIETLRAAIGEQLQALKDRWFYLIPQNWLRLKEALADRWADKTLSRAHYAQLCIQHGVKHADTLLGYLHDSGFLFYRHDHFGNQLILDQNWIINIIYRLLDPAEHIRKRLIRQSGVFSGDDTGDFWRDYDLEEREIFTDFMLNCEMAFALDKDYWQKDFNDRQFVLPALLPQMPPLGVKVWGVHQPGEWWLDFSYSFLHRALIERLIVHTARLSPERDWWRDGILLDDNETGCQLLLHYQPEPRLSQVIRLRIRGQQKTHAYARVSNLLAELHPHRQPQVFASLEGRQFVSLEALQQAVQAGQAHLACRDGQIVASQPYREFLHTLDREERFAMPPQQPPPVRIFISYAHEDEAYKNDLETRLKGIKRQLNIDYWSDRQLFAGEPFQQKIFEQLKQADIICLLISPDFIASDYCFNKEMEQALQQYEQNAGIPIPIIIRPTDEWQAHRIGQHTALPTDGKPLKQWSDPDDFWADVQQGIYRQVKRIMEQRAERRP